MNQEPEIGTAPNINEFITADPVRLIAPKIRHIQSSASTEDDDDNVGDENMSGDEDSIEEDDDQSDEADDDVAEENGSAAGNGATEEMLGIYSLEDALQKAHEFNLDLVMINENADPPICKIIDYGKYKYRMDRKKKDNLKKQVRGGIKEVKMSYKIDVHDFDVRVRNAQKFIAAGDRVKVTVQFRGREMQHKDLAFDVLMRFFDTIAATSVLESPPKMEGRQMFMYVAGKKTPKR